MCIDVVEFQPDDFREAERMATHLGYKQTAYTSHALPGLYCLPDGPHHRSGAIVKSRQYGFLFIQDAEDMHLPEKKS
jgi:hypothetical protein